MIRKKTKTNSKKKKGVIYLFNDILVIASRETGLLGGEKLKYQWALPLARTTIIDSKQIYQGPQRKASISTTSTNKNPSSDVHPVKLIQTQLGCNPEQVFQILHAPERTGDSQLETLKSSRDLLAIEDAPENLSIVVVAANAENAKKWIEKINDEQKTVLDKDKAREEAIKKSKQTSFNFLMCISCGGRPGKAYIPPEQAKKEEKEEDKEVEKEEEKQVEKQAEQEVEKEVEKEIEKEEVEKELNLET